MILSTAIGRLTKDPELRTVNIGGNPVAVCDFSIACNKGYGDNRKTEFVDCVAWRGLAETIAKNLTKGRQIFIRGEQETSKYTITKDGVEFSVKDVKWVVQDFTFLDSNPSAQQGGQQQGGYQQPQQQGGYQQAPPQQQYQQQPQQYQQPQQPQQQYQQAPQGQDQMWQYANQQPMQQPMQPEVPGANAGTKLPPF